MQKPSHQKDSSPGEADGARDFPQPMRSHPERFALQNEIHARPRLAVASPQSVSHIALLGPEGQAVDPTHPGSLYAAIGRLCERLGRPGPPPGVRHFFGDFGSFRLKWERHGEFDDLTVYRDDCSAAAPFADPALSALPADWLASLPGQQIAGLHVAVLPAETRESFADLFDRESLTAATLADGAATACTDFRVGPDGFTRFLLLTRDTSRTLTGREVQRLIEIEVYRMMAMLAFPLARRTAGELDAVERELSELVARLETAEATDEPALLRQITRLAATVERIAGTTGFRFAAARAYHAIVQQRGAGLRDGRLPGLQTPTGFLERRFGPAMAFCESVARRVDATAERIARASALLRTRVDIERERQNQELLAAMNRRARLQLNLQQTVEGLSVAAITYYAVGLVGYIAKAAKAGGWPVDPDLAAGLSVVPIAIAVALGIRHIREGIRRRLGSGAAGNHD
ncbi:DUF3422 domain-containing protein [Burkholderiaceae bacterium FT117]|uniref:DUF3422 family protein n=1 Tax=Zeimonas sediminis TaxID=2944268 RepID=UPI002342D417|nr:DUF3422 domain-containing protein [Zeimonas sediminis]MCM5569522.1 DUF3422 domain-containing protein [Zeimonas sediminis]